MNFGRRTPEAEARQLIDRALDSGATALDTANLYGDGESERIIGRALRGRRERAQVTTKCGLWKREGLAPERIVQALDASLERLECDFVDCLVLHAPDATTPIERTLDGIASVLEAKKAASWGVSNFAAWQIVELNQLCDARTLARPRQSQVLYNLAVRQLELEYFAFSRRFPIETVTFNPLAGGLLALDPSTPRPTKARIEANPIYRKRYGSEPLRGFAARCAEHGKRFGVSLHDLSLRWLFHRPGVDVVLLGPATMAQLEQALSTSRDPLPPELTAALDEEHRQFLGTDAIYAR